MAEVKARRRALAVFGLSFLDAMTCGFGAVILLYMVINASVGLRTDRLTGELRAETDRLEREVLDGLRRLVETRNSLRAIERQKLVARGLSSRLIESIDELEIELADYENTTLARQEHIERLMADLRSLEESTRRLSASLPSDEPAGDRLRAFVGDGDRQYLTGLKVGGRRILILVDASASMLGETLVNVVRRRNLPAERRILADKWQRAVSTVDWLVTQIPRESEFQLFTFNESARAVIPESEGEWLDGGAAPLLDRAVTELRRIVPQGGTNLFRAFQSIGSLRPAPDNLILLIDGLPTLGRSPPRSRTVSAKRRLELFEQAYEELPPDLPVNVLLFPMEGDPKAPAAFWRMAMATRGSFISPSEDWP